MVAVKKKTKETEPQIEQTLSFAAETSRVLHLMIHALYTNRDIFLRELISNASDACDKLRYAALTDNTLLGDAPDLKIHLTLDDKANTIRIEDTGIGMSRDELIEHLGTIAKSGTTDFVNKLTGDDARDVNLIGQFGVGFYASFMVADRVTVESRAAGSNETWLWESAGAGEYTIRAGQSRARGTAITLHLKTDAKPYLDRHKLGHIVATYSDHIGFPITLTDSEGATHTLNEGSAIWVRPKAEVTDEQYQEFYRHVAHSPEKPWAVLHNKAEGVLEYTSLLFIPAIKPLDLFNPDRVRRVKLYVKRVYITDEGVELVPAYLRFLRGVIDSTDLPLNISRETLQKSSVLEKIRDSVTSRVLSELKKRAEKNIENYSKFWNNFGAVVKEGLCESMAPRDKILDACRFYSTHGEGLVSLSEYKSRMQPEQDAIYFLTGDHLASMRHSPQIEGFRKRGIEVLLLNDHVDDFWTNVTLKWGDIAFRSVTKAGADLKPTAEEPADNDAAIGSLIAAMKLLYGDKVRDVRTTRKLSDTPVCLGVGEGDMEMRMERFLLDHKQLPRAQAKIIEINPAHPVVQSLANRIANDGSRDDTDDALWLLFDQALIAEGEPVPDASAFAKRLAKLIERGLV